MKVYYSETTKRSLMGLNFLPTYILVNDELIEYTDFDNKNDDAQLIVEIPKGTLCQLSIGGVTHPYTANH